MIVEATDNSGETHEIDVNADTYSDGGYSVEIARALREGKIVYRRLHKWDGMRSSRNFENWIVDKSNEAAIKDSLEDFDAWEWCSLYVCVDPTERESLETIRVCAELSDAIESYPILDESDFSDRCYDYVKKKSNQLMNQCSREVDLPVGLLESIDSASGGMISRALIDYALSCGRIDVRGDVARYVRKAVDECGWNISV